MKKVLSRISLIVAAGLGSRLKSHTENTPKCMLDFGGKTLLQRQLLSYKQNGVDDISLVRGYKKNKINYKGIKYFDNNNYKDNNILNSIFYGEKAINGNIIISYSDILFEPFVVKRAMEADHDISVIVDVDWKHYYVDRKDHPLSEAENVIFNSNNELVWAEQVSVKSDGKYSTLAIADGEGWTNSGNYDLKVNNGLATKSKFFTFNS